MPPCVSVPTIVAAASTGFPELTGSRKLTARSHSTGLWSRSRLPAATWPRSANAAYLGSGCSTCATLKLTTVRPCPLSSVRGPVCLAPPGLCPRGSFSAHSRPTRGRELRRGHDNSNPAARGRPWPTETSCDHSPLCPRVRPTYRRYTSVFHRRRHDPCAPGGASAPACTRVPSEDNR